MTTKSGDIKRKILKTRGVQLQHLTRKPITYDDVPAIFHKTRLMRYVELKFHNSLKKLIFKGTVRATSKQLGIDYSTVSKWRKVVSEADDKEFFAQFE